MQKKEKLCEAICYTFNNFLLVFYFLIMLVVNKCVKVHLENNGVKKKKI